MTDTAVLHLDACDEDEPDSLTSHSLSVLNEEDKRKNGIQQRMRAIPRLSESEERALTNLVASQPQSPQARDAIHQLTLANLRLVEHFAKKSWGQGVDLDDLIQEGTLGLIKAIQDFNPASGNRLSTYAVNWIRQYMQRAIANQGKSLRRPVNVQAKQRQLRNVTADLEQTLMRTPTRDEITQAFGERYGATSTAELDDLLAHDPHLVSLDQSVDEDASTVLGDFVTSGAEPLTDGMYQQDLHNQLVACLGVLSDRSRAIVECVYGWNDREPMTLSEIGHELHLSRERVRQLLNEALEVLREEAQHHHLSDYRYR